MNAYPKVPLYLFYGNQVEPILSARDQVLDAVLDRELRDENLTEYRASGNRFGVELAKLMPEIAGDLSTLSFMPDASKVAVVTNPAELYGSATARRRAPKKKSAAKKGTKKGSADENWMKWIEKGLPETGNTLILLALEDESEGREVNDRHPLIQLVGRIGYFQAFRDKKAFWRIEDALLQRDCSGCVAAIRGLWKFGKGDAAVYGAVVRCMRFMLQANIRRDKRVGNRPELIELVSPARVQHSLFKASEFVQKKYTRRPIPYRTRALLEAYRELLGVYRALRPRPGDLFVPDARALLERILMKLFFSPRP